MISAFVRFRGGVVTGLVGAVAVAAFGQTEHHSRRYKPLEPAAKITVVVEKAANGKPISNAAVIFRAMKNGKNEGSLEIKTDPDGHAMLDVIEVGSHVTVQVIADGFATNVTEFDVPTEEKSVVMKMEKPRAQVSTYVDNDGKPAQLPPGVQEPRAIAKPKPPVKKTTPTALTTAPVAPVSTPETAAPSKGSSASAPSTPK